MYKFININSADFSGLAQYLNAEFDPSNVVKMLRESASAEVAGVLVEYPYVDKDYRSTYYNFYSKKARYYNRQSVRLHFFSQGVSLGEGLKLIPSDNEELSDLYLGFTVLRPTWSFTIGRSALSPKFLKNFVGHVMLAQHKVHVLGKKITVAGFPWMQQHTDIAVCAHVACWSVLRYYSERFSGHREYLIHDVTCMASQYDQGGLLPSRGLYVGQAARIFAEGGVFPDVYTKSAFKTAFLRYLYAYVESGFPIFAAMHGRKHAITIIGHGAVGPAVALPGAGVQYSWEQIRSLVAVDDNWMPYQVLPDVPANDYGIEAVDTFVVPLPDKIYLPAESVEKYALNVFNQSPFGLDFTGLNNPVMRYLLTTASTLQRWALDQDGSSVPPKLLAAIMDMPLPRFLWVVEIGGLTSWNKKCCNLRFIFDATASAQEKLVFVLLHDATHAIVHDRSSEIISVKKVPLTDQTSSSGRFFEMPLFDGNLYSF